MTYHKVYKEKSEFALPYVRGIEVFLMWNTLYMYVVNCGECIEQKVTFL